MDLFTIYRELKYIDIIWPMEQSLLLHMLLNLMELILWQYLQIVSYYLNKVPLWLLTKFIWLLIILIIQIFFLVMYILILMIVMEVRVITNSLMVIFLSLLLYHIILILINWFWRNNASYSGYRVNICIFSNYCSWV